VISSPTSRNVPSPAISAPEALIEGVDSILANKDLSLSALHLGVGHGLDSILGVFRLHELDYSAALGLTLLIHEDLSEGDFSGVPHVVLEILPAGLVAQVAHIDTVVDGSTRTES
tara:strand:+ start:273 stop:617 length:345 start_codon:yes stop_codon:yes gene_type:complete